MYRQSMLKPPLSLCCRFHREPFCVGSPTDFAITPSSSLRNYEMVADIIMIG